MVKGLKQVGGHMQCSRIGTCGRAVDMRYKAVLQALDYAGHGVLVQSRWETRRS